MVINKLTGKMGIGLFIALLCIAVLVIPVSASTGRTVPGNVQPEVVNASPQTAPVAPSPERLVVVTTTTPVPQRGVVVTTTTIPVVNEPRVIPAVTTIAVRTTLQPVVGQVRVVNVTNTGTASGTGSKIVSAENRQVAAINPADLVKKDIEETQVVVKDPKTGKVLTNDNPGSDLPGGKNINMPSAEDRWNNRFGAGGPGGVTDGTLFDDNPNSNPMDGFFSTYGSNLLNPFAAYGSTRGGLSSAIGGTKKGNAIAGYGSRDDRGSAASSSSPGTAGIADFYGGDDTIAAPSSGSLQFRDYSMVEVGISPTDLKEANFLQRYGDYNAQEFEEVGKLYGGHNLQNDQQYEGEGGYTGGGHSANDIMVGSRRVTGIVVVDAGEAGLGQDTGSKKPALFTAIEQYVARGGKVRGSIGGYEIGNSGQGNDIAGSQENRVTALKNALAARRFVVDADATSAEQVPWWMEERVQPKDLGYAAQAAGGVQAGMEQAASQNAQAGQTK
jgi:hypothetical protein